MVLIILALLYGFNTFVYFDGLIKNCFLNFGSFLFFKYYSSSVLQMIGKRLSRQHSYDDQFIVILLHALVQLRKKFKFLYQVNLDEVLSQIIRFWSTLA